MKCVSCKQELISVSAYYSPYYCPMMGCNGTTLYINGIYSIKTIFNGRKCVMEGQPLRFRFSDPQTLIWDIETRRTIIKMPFVKLPMNESFNLEFDKLKDKIEKMMLLQ